MTVRRQVVRSVGEIGCVGSRKMSSEMGVLGMWYVCLV